MWCRTLTVVGLLAFGLPALGDVVHFKNGAALEGQVVETPTGIVLKLPAGDITIAKDAIARIEKREAPLDEFQKRAAALKDGDAEGHYQLGLWSQGRNLKPQAREEFQKTIAANPDHAGARQALGYHNINGKWMTPEDQMQAQGLVKYEGQWMPPDAVAKILAAKTELEAAREKRLAAEAELKKVQEQLKAAQQPPGLPVYSTPAPYDAYSTRLYRPYYPPSPYYGYQSQYYSGYPLPYYYSPFGIWHVYPGGRRFVPYRFHWSIGW